MTSPNAEFTSPKALLAVGPQNRYHGMEDPHISLLGRNAEEEGDTSQDTAAWLWLQSSYSVPLPILG